MAYPVVSETPSPYAREIAAKVVGDLGSAMVSGSDFIIDLIAAIYLLEGGSAFMDSTALDAIATACTDA